MDEEREKKTKASAQHFTVLYTLAVLHRGPAESCEIQVEERMRTRQGARGAVQCG